MEENEQLQKFICDQTKKPEASIAGSKQTSKTKEEATHIDRRKGMPAKTIVSYTITLTAQQTQMLGKKKVLPEPAMQDEKKGLLMTLNSSKTTNQTANPTRQSYMGCQSSMMKLIKTSTANEEPKNANKGKTPIMFGQLMKRGPGNSLPK